MSASQGRHSNITLIDNGSDQSVSHVLLHGIGSNAQSWSEVLKLIPAQQRWLAWNAPGYDNSQALVMSKPKALDYAQALWSRLDDLKVTALITLAGHSLGALMAASAARLQS
jgi:pimeloyl-ACP methyl ester carboxylesterase